MKYIFSLALALSLFACNAQQENGSATGFTDINKTEAQALIASNPELQIIDVRTDGEVAAGMIEGAIQIDISQADFKTKINQLDKSKPVLVYCKSGGRSKNAQSIMQQSGFQEVHNLLGGYMAWK
jgi:rhodanese-related sulfurtransferase